MSREDEVRKLQEANHEMTVRHATTGSSGTVLIGVVVIVIGLAFLSMIMTKSAGADLIPRQVIPILAFLGGVLMTGSGKAAEGLVLMVLGLIFILRNLGIVSAESFDLIWFGILVLVGLWLVLNAKITKSSAGR